MFVSLLPYMFRSPADHHQGLIVPRSATRSPYVVCVPNLTLACGLLSVNT